MVDGAGTVGVSELVRGAERMPTYRSKATTLTARRIAAGLSIPDLAKAANICELTVRILENGGTAHTHELERLMDACAPPVAITSNSQANPTSVLTATPHAFQTNDTVVLTGITGANADPNGTRVATRVDSTHFTVPVNCTTAPGTGGTARGQVASLGQVEL
jgi:hypothetical protein